jgi:lysophospholipase L1-like esterase
MAYLLPSRYILGAGAFAGLFAATGLATAGLLFEGNVARLRITKVMKTTWMVPYTDGRYGPTSKKPTTRMAILGDSLACGFGVKNGRDTVGPLVAKKVSEHTGEQVLLRNYAQVGATSASLDAQVAQAHEFKPDITLIIIGANDVTRARTGSSSLRALRNAITALQRSGSTVVVGTCPDLGQVGRIPAPLRDILRVASLRYGRSQTRAVTDLGAIPVKLSQMLDDVPATTLFTADGFHPSAVGHRLAAQLLAAPLTAMLTPAPFAAGTSTCTDLVFRTVAPLPARTQ